MESEELAGAKKQGEIRGKKEEEDEKARNKGQNEKKNDIRFIGSRQDFIYAA